MARRALASLLILQGARPKAIQDHLGHKDIQTTFNVYGQLLPSVQEALGASLDAAYEGSAGVDTEDVLTSAMVRPQPTPG